jgi:hypothetical protein
MSFRLLALVRGRTGGASTNARAGRKTRAGRRGMSTLSLTLETASVMSWFVFMILGEKLVGDSASARRATETTTQQSARVSGASGCTGGEQGATSGSFSATPQSSVDEIGTPDIGQLISLVEMLGFGSGQQATFQYFTNQFKQTTVTAQVDNVKAPILIGGNNLSFKAVAQSACREKTYDQIGTSITQYRNSVFTTNIQGWSLSQ